MRQSVGDDLIAAGLAGGIGYALGQYTSLGKAGTALLIAGAVLLVGVVFRVAGRHETLARVAISNPAVNPEQVTSSGGSRAVHYARVRVTNQSRRIAAQVIAALTVEGADIHAVPLHWRHEVEPATVREVNVTQNPPVLLAPRQERELDIAIHFDGDGSLYAASLLSYRAPWLQHAELRLPAGEHRVHIDVTGLNVRPTRQSFRLGTTPEGLHITDV